ncbi:MAG TPA: hypothetical protein VHX38_29620 [Pseudonocardiaceae bacterium]|nr:hypothetical protein [Pseudonocardiaceae bacterium]
MNSPFFSWASMLVTLAAALIAASVTWQVERRNRRTEADHQWNKEKAAAYAPLRKSARELARIAVWPRETGEPAVDIRPLFEELEDIAASIAFFGSAGVNAAIAELLTAATEFAETVRVVRSTSEPGYHGDIDQRVAGRYQEADRKLGAAIEVFTEAGRVDLLR